MQNRQTLEMIKFQGQVRPYAVQLFGANPEEMAQAAKIIESLNICDIIDINMGCPVPKVVKTGAGSALMKTPKLAAKILKSVSSAVSLPITIKCRLGWSKESINVTDFVKCMLDNDAKAVTVHARTRQAGYSGEACWEYLQAPAAICGSVPFIANGDITSEQDVLKLHSLADCDGFMIGRGAVGKPWIFSELLGHRCFNDAEIRFKVFKHHLIDMLMEHGPKAAPLFRVHLFGYLKNHPNAAKARFFLCNERDPDKILLTGKKFFFNQPLAIFANTLQDLATNVD
jgi:tRNA-dihydrouridine synthase B